MRAEDPQGAGHVVRVASHFKGVILHELSYPVTRDLKLSPGDRVDVCISRIRKVKARGKMTGPRLQVSLHQVWNSELSEVLPFLLSVTLSAARMQCPLQFQVSPMKVPARVCAWENRANNLVLKLLIISQAN